MDLPLARLIFMLNKELADVFKHELDIAVNAPIPLKSITDKVLAMAGFEIHF